MIFSIFCKSNTLNDPSFSYFLGRHANFKVAPKSRLNSLLKIDPVLDKHSSTSIGLNFAKKVVFYCSN